MKSSIHSRQSGVVLIVALILLVVMSLISAASIRGSSSSELSSNNTRTQALAMQAAEAALRNCENASLSYMADNSTGRQPEAAPVLGSPYRWQSLANWDDKSGSPAPDLTKLTVLTGTDIGNVSTFYKRFPECMAQYVDTKTTTVVVTARGFGPEVPALVGSARPAPAGTEVWLQSVVDRTP